MKNTLITFAAIFFLTSVANSQLNMEWLQSYDANHGEEFPRKMCQDKFGNIYVTGKSQAGGLSTSYDIATIKYSQSGEEIWVRRYNGIPEFSHDWSSGLGFDTSGNIYVSGTSYNIFQRNTTTLIKYSPSGNEEWFRNFNFSDSSSSDQTSDMILDKSDNIYITGISRDYLNNYYPIIVKYNIDGNILWSHTHKNHSLSIAYTTAPKLTTDSFGNIYIAANSKDGILLMKYNPDGVFQWESITIGSMNSMAIDSLGNVFISGKRNYFALTMKYNSSGSVLWEKEFRTTLDNGQAEAYSIGLDYANNVFTLGWDSGNPNWNKDVFLIKYDQFGNMLWWRKYDGTINGYDEGHKLTLDNNNNIFVIGVFNYNFTFIMKYDSSGFVKWTRVLDISGGNIEGIDIVLDNSGNVYGCSSSMVSGQRQNYLTFKYSQGTGVYSNSGNIPHNFSLSQNYPNPFNPTTHLKFGIGDLGFVSLKVYDLLGKEVATLVNEKLSPGSYSVEFDGSNLSSGMYFYKLTSNGFSEVKKMTFLK